MGQQPTVSRSNKPVRLLNHLVGKHNKIVRHFEATTGLLIPLTANNPLRPPAAGFDRTAFDRFTTLHGAFLGLIHVGYASLIILGCVSYAGTTSNTSAGASTSLR